MIGTGDGDTLGYGSFGVSPHCLACPHLRRTVDRGKFSSFYPWDEDEASDSKTPLKVGKGLFLRQKGKGRQVPPVNT